MVSRVFQCSCCMIISEWWCLGLAASGSIYQEQLVAAGPPSASVQCINVMNRAKLSCHMSPSASFLVWLALCSRQMKLGLMIVSSHLSACNNGLQHNISFRTMGVVADAVA